MKGFEGGEKCENFSKCFHCNGQPAQNGKFFKVVRNARISQMVSL